MWQTIYEHPDPCCRNLMHTHDLQWSTVMLSNVDWCTCVKFCMGQLLNISYVDFAFYVHCRNLTDCAYVHMLYGPSLPHALLPSHSEASSL